MASPEGTRAAKVSDRIREELMDMFLRGDVHDPDVEGCVISAVSVTRDLSLARVFVRLLDPAPSIPRQKRLVRALGRAQPFLRREVARRVALRRAPDLRFAWDDVADRAQRVEELLHDVAEEKNPKGRGE
jgi:ribosome-binding factor A